MPRWNRVPSGNGSVPFIIFFTFLSAAVIARGLSTGPVTVALVTGMRLTAVVVETRRWLFWRRHPDYRMASAALADAFRKAPHHELLRTPDGSYVTCHRAHRPRRMVITKLDRQDVDDAVDGMAATGRQQVVIYHQYVRGVDTHRVVHYQHPSEVWPNGEEEILDVRVSALQRILTNRTGLLDTTPAEIWAVAATLQAAEPASQGGQ